VRVLLRSDVTRVGHKGDLIDVSDGFARNYLIPKGLALRATKGAEGQAQGMRRARDVKDARDRQSAETIARELVAVQVRIPARAGTEGRLFGSVTTADIVSAVQQATGIELDRRRVHLDEPIKALGVHEVPVRLHTDVEFAVTVEVVAGEQ
jgi:large subunit ribosomal protein L9